MAKKKLSVVERLNKPVPGAKRLCDLTPDERAAFEAEMAAIFNEGFVEAPKRALRAANLPDDHAEALRIILFDSDPAIALESDDAFDDIPIDNIMDLARVYAAKERSRAAFKLKPKIPPKPRNDNPTPQDVDNVRKVMDGMGTKNPKVRAVRKAVKDAGYSLSNAKISAAIKKNRE